MDGYVCFTNIGEDHAHRGVVIYTKCGLKAQQVSTEDIREVVESVWVEIPLRNDEKLLVGNVYRSPHSSEMNNNRLNKLLCDMSKDRSHVLITGDFNHPEIDWISETTSVNAEHKAAEFLDTVHDTFLHQHVCKPTHYRGEQTPNVLDLIFSSEEGMVKNLRHMAPLGKSHHHVLQFDFVCYTPSYRSNEAKFNFAKGNYDKLRSYVRGQDLLSQIQGKCVSEAWSCFKKTLDEGISQCIPKSRVGTPNGPKRPPWGYRAMAKIKKKRHAYQRYLETREGKDYLAYARARNQAKGACRKAVKEHEQAIAKEVKKNPKAFYAYARSKMKTKEGVSDLVDDKGQKVSDDKGKADILNNFFCSVFTKENLDGIPSADSVLGPEKSKLETIAFSSEAVLKKLKSLDPCKACGPDGLHPRLLKELAEELAEPLSVLFTISLEEGKLPETWKDANVTPLFKKGDKSAAGNYRPVSLTSVLCKIMEALIRDSVVLHMESNGLVSEHQHGFIAKRSCVTNLLSVLDKWTELLDEGMPVDVIYLDFAKAFDSVPHVRLLRKLESFGITSHVSSWIQDFLVGRRQRVRINGNYSDWAPVASGVPQGSVLGPVLFVLYINDLPDAVHSLCEMYADDTKMFSSVETEELRVKLQSDLDNLVNWADHWQLRFNADKCKVLHLGRNNPKHQYVMRKHGSEDKVTLGTTQVEKDLGVHVDDELKFSIHIQTQVSKANKILGLIRRSYQHLDRNSVKMLFTALVRPHLEFANVAWSPRFKKDKKLIEGVLRRASKLVPELKELEYEQRLQRMGLPSMQYRRDRGDMIEVFKLTHDMYNVNMKQDLFDLDTSSVTRGHKYKLTKHRWNSSLRQQFFTFRVVDKWNMLPASVVEAPTLQVFKNRLDGAWSHLQFKSCATQ